LGVTLQRPHRSRDLRHGWDHRRRLHEQRRPTARSLGWATSKVSKRVSKKAAKPKPLPSPSACLGIAAAP
jgi:methylthioribose-1-phosphate isomerase